METADCVCAIMMGRECEILILPSSSPSAFPHSHTRAVSHASATSFNRMGRARPAASGEICLFWGHYAMTLCSLCGSHTVPPIANGEKRKMDITPYGSTCVCSCAYGASPSFPSPPSSFPREYSNSPKKKRNICHLYAENPIRAGQQTPLNATPRFYAKLSLPTPPLPRHKRAVFCGTFLRTLFSPCRACERVSHCTCDVLLTHDRNQSPFSCRLAPSPLS